nr:helix-turn-helix domain-containing protein [Mesorhizobium liriopis]
MTERLARLLLLCHDRADGDVIQLTHEFMARMVAGQRTTVTAILHVLEGEGLIRNKRGVVIVKNRVGLENRAEEAYRWPIPEAAAQVQAV